MFGYLACIKFPTLEKGGDCNLQELLVEGYPNLCDFCDRVRDTFFVLHREETEQQEIPVALPEPHTASTSGQQQQQEQESTSEQEEQELKIQQDTVKRRVYFFSFTAFTVLMHLAGNPMIQRAMKSITTAPGTNEAQAEFPEGDFYGQ